MPHDRLRPSDTFARRHLGPNQTEEAAMLRTLGLTSAADLVAQTIPASIRRNEPLTFAGLAAESHRGENEMLRELRAIVSENRLMKNFIGMGYYGTITPGVILRNILENPGFYTQYTPYQPEISQGRLEALLNFQTMVSDLCGMTLANASLLDEATAAAEAMTMCKRIAKGGNVFFISEDCHPQVIAVTATRAEPLGIEIVVGKPSELDLDAKEYFGVLLAYPTTDGRIEDYRGLIERAHAKGALVTMATDLLALTMLVPPGELGADIAIGSAQRFGVPLGYGGPHAAFMATNDKHSRFVPGRIIGVSKDARGRKAMRLALQTREQHIRRDRATSNICTAQVLLAIISGMYATYHGPEGLKQIAERVRGMALAVAQGLRTLGFELGDRPFFDTLHVRVAADASAPILERAEQAGLNLRAYPDGSIGISVDETTTLREVAALLAVFGPGGAGADAMPDATSLAKLTEQRLPDAFVRTSSYLQHPVFNSYHSETELLRYIYRLQGRDLSLTTSMIPLGSCTMKLNATSEMIPVTWPEIGFVHPFAPASQTRGYARIIGDLEQWLAEITGFAATSLQPNAGAQGEYAGLLVIRAYHLSRGDVRRDVCLIPTSAHGTNPATATLAGMRVVAVACDDKGNVDLADLRAKATQHKDNLACIMITYPSTHGVFEERIREICDVVHEAGGQVYMDGANMNAQVGLCRPGDFGPDVCHLNLHKTFCIPHGGGGPGMGPICVAKHLAPFLPMHPLAWENRGTTKAIGPVSAAPFGSASILVIPWMYIAMMGADGLRRATEMAIVNANYMAKRLEGSFEILYRGSEGRVAHEFILDCRPFKKGSGIEVEDIAKRLMDYGFHAPTMSFPVPGTLMIEPTESESKAELDRFCDAMLAIRAEIRQIEEGKLDKTDNPLKNAPHTAEVLTAEEWAHKYPRALAAYPAPWLREHKFWPPVSRVDNAYGDRNLICTCEPIESYE
ncbi:MAG: aminomethyl-transferring glycine dehydrogenase [Polyangiaceae bacterium]|nr:aminomethyl-transferring glycine dehydrogenase [Polyangiaceae bacterium]